MTICNAWTSLAVENHTLGDRWFAETVAFIVEWYHLLFAVCVQSLHLQLVTATYTGNILWQEDYWQPTVHTCTDTIWQLILQHCLPLSSQNIPQQSATSTVLCLLNRHAHSAMHCSQCSVSNLRYMFWHSAVSPSQLFAIQLWYRLLKWRFPLFITVWEKNTSALTNIKTILQHTYPFTNTFTNHWRYIMAIYSKLS